MGKSDHLSSPTPGCDIMICGSFWKCGGHDDDRDVVSDGVEGEQQIAAHIEVELARGQEKLVVRPGDRPARSSHRGRIWRMFRRPAPDNIRRARPRRASSFQTTPCLRRAPRIAAKEKPAERKRPRRFMTVPQIERPAPSLATSTPMRKSARLGAEERRPGGNFGDLFPMRRLNPATIHPPFANYAHGVEVGTGEPRRLLLRPAGRRHGTAPFQIRSRSRRASAFARSRRSSAKRA